MNQSLLATSSGIRAGRWLGEEEEEQGLAQMHRDMQNLQRQVADLTNVLASQRIIQREVFDEETNQGDVDQHIEHEEEQLECMNFEERMLRALEGRNDGIKMEVSEYAGSLKPEELIDWLNTMEFFFEWKPMTEEKKVKFACTKLKGHAMIWWDHVQKDRKKKGKDKIRTWNKMEKNCENFFFLWTMPRPFFVDFRT
jgi:hypothetical protein